MKTKKSKNLSVFSIELKDKLSVSNQGNTQRPGSKTCSCGCLNTKLII